MSDRRTVWVFATAQIPTPTYAVPAKDGVGRQVVHQGRNQIALDFKPGTPIPVDEVLPHNSLTVRTIAALQLATLSLKIGLNTIASFDMLEFQMVSALVNSRKIEVVQKGTVTLNPASVRDSEEHGSYGVWNNDPVAYVSIEITCVLTLDRFSRTVSSEFTTSPKSMEVGYSVEVHGYTFNYVYEQLEEIDHGIRAETDSGSSS